MAKDDECVEKKIFRRKKKTTALQRKVRKEYFKRHGRYPEEDGCYLRPLR